MKIQKFILDRKKYIAILGAVLIAAAFIAKYAFRQEKVAEWALIIASVFGVLPIAIQAFQALRVKVVSIDLLVTIAVIGAFIIKNYEESAIVTFFLFGAYWSFARLTKRVRQLKN